MEPRRELGPVSTAAPVSPVGLCPRLTLGKERCHVGDAAFGQFFGGIFCSLVVLTLAVLAVCLGITGLWRGPWVHVTNVLRSAGAV